MCSSPKGGSTKPLLSSNVKSTSGDMTSAEYCSMVHRANESYERRQEELIEYRKTHRKKLTPINNKQTDILNNKQIDVSFFEKFKNFFGQIGSSQQIRE